MKSLSDISKSITSKFPSIGRVVISKRKTAPKIGAHLREIDCVHGGKSARILKGFNSKLSHAEKVKEVKLSVCEFIAIPGCNFTDQQVIVLGNNNKVLHGCTRTVIT